MRHEYLDGLEDFHIPLAQHEDHWEEILCKEFGFRDKSGKMDTFAAPLVACKVELLDMMRRREKKNIGMAFRLVDIVEKEKELAIEERDERRRIAWERRQEKNRAKGRVEERSETGLL